MWGGRQEDFVRVKPILETFSNSVAHVGKNGMGLYAKIVAGEVPLVWEADTV